MYLTIDLLSKHGTMICNAMRKETVAVKKYDDEST